MEYTIENHYSTFLLNESKEDLNIKNCKKAILSINGNIISNPIEIDFKGNSSWILSAELKILEHNNLKPSDLKVLMYVEGLLSPYVKTSNIESSIDGYELHIMY